MPVHQKADTEEEMRHLLDLADDLQAKLDQELTRVSSVRVIAVVGFICTALAFAVFAALRGTSDLLVVGAAGVGAAVMVAFLTQTLLSRPLTMRAHRDERALSEVVRILRESLGVVEHQNNWSAFRRAEFRVRLARFQDTGDLSVGLHAEAPDRSAIEITKWGPEVTRTLTQTAVDSLDLLVIDPQKATASSWMSLPEFLQRGGTVRLLLPNLFDQRIRTQIGVWFDFGDQSSTDRLLASVRDFHELAIRAGVKPNQCQIRTGNLIPSFDVMLADSLTGMLGIPGDSGRTCLQVRSGSPLAASLVSSFARAWGDAQIVSSSSASGGATPARGVRAS